MEVGHADVGGICDTVESGAGFRVLEIVQVVDEYVEFVPEGGGVAEVLHGVLHGGWRNWIFVRFYGGSLNVRCAELWKQLRTVETPLNKVWTGMLSKRTLSMVRTE